MRFDPLRACGLALLLGLALPPLGGAMAETPMEMGIRVPDASQPARPTKPEPARPVAQPSRPVK